MLLEKNPASGFACLLQETRGSLGMRIMRDEVVSNTVVAVTIESFFYSVLASSWHSAERPAR